MSQPREFEARLARAEADAAAARHLAAAHDRDLADLGVKVDANRKAINALGIQTAARFERLEKKVDDGFAEMRTDFAQVDRNFAQVDQNFLTIRGLLDATAAAQERTAELLTILIDERGDR